MTYRIHGTDAGIEYDSGEVPFDQLPLSSRGLSSRESIASYFYGNMFDGQRGGRVTMDIDRLVDEMVTVVYFIFDDVAKALMPEGYDQP